MTTTLVTGGAGFLGSHLCDRLRSEGHRVLCIDNLVTGSEENLKQRSSDPDFRFIHHDISRPIEIDEPLDNIFHFASPASPIDYLELPIQTLKVGSLGTHNTLGLAMRHGATYVLSSTSEVYGDPLVQAHMRCNYKFIHLLPPPKISYLCSYLYYHLRNCRQKQRPFDRQFFLTLAFEQPYP